MPVQSTPLFDGSLSPVLVLKTLARWPARAGLMLSLCLLYACAIPSKVQVNPPALPPVVYVDSSNEPITLEQAIVRIERLENTLTLFVCGPQLKVLINEARAMCANEDESVKETGNNRGGERAEPMCNDKKLKVPLAVAERELLEAAPNPRAARGGAGRVRDIELSEQNIGGKLMALRHEVIYLNGDGTLASTRMQRLRAFAEEKRLPFTRFLIITDGEGAPNRAVAAKQLLEKVLAEQASTEPAMRSAPMFEPPWIIPMRVRLFGPDRRQPMEPRIPAVFIFRTDCPE
ncbi:MAG TPA: hypothetical protein PKI03_18185 [Pseudomonadota bacterium]|nr:hypothetical protein [Pseudomonadota bacterium]